MHADLAAIFGDGFGGSCSWTSTCAAPDSPGRARGHPRGPAPRRRLHRDPLLLEAGWAAGLLAAYDEGADAAGPVFRNGNPESRSSAAGFLAHYGTFADPPPPPPWPDLPGHNSSYRRELLLAFGDELAGLLELEYLMHARMLREGSRLVLERRARVRHVNVSRRRSAPPRGLPRRAHLRCGARARLAARAPDPQAAAWPLIAVVRTRRHAADAQRIGVARTPGLIAALAVRLACTSAGEAVGLLAGAGAADVPMLEMELRRDRS